MVVIHSEANILLDGEEERGEGELIKKKKRKHKFISSSTRLSNRYSIYIM